MTEKQTRADERMRVARRVNSMSGEKDDMRKVLYDWAAKEGGQCIGVNTQKSKDAMRLYRMGQRLLWAVANELEASEAA